MLFRGACPVGGVEVRDFATTPARYCAITGGTYSAIARQGAPDEQGTCKFANGKECAAAAYHLGTCTAACQYTRAAPGLGCQVKPLGVDR